MSHAQASSPHYLLQKLCPSSASPVRRVRCGGKEAKLTGLGRVNLSSSPPLPISRTIKNHENRGCNICIAGRRRRVVIQLTNRRKGSRTPLFPLWTNRGKQTMDDLLGPDREVFFSFFWPIVFTVDHCYRSERPSRTPSDSFSPRFGILI